jgi:hypothetical protein
MFIISHFILDQTKMLNIDHISSYAITIGMIVYASIYLYLLFYNNDYLSIFNKFIIYIIGIDLLLSTFYYFNSSNSKNTHFSNTSQNDENYFADMESYSSTDIDTHSELESDFEVNEEHSINDESEHSVEDDNILDENLNVNDPTITPQNSHSELNPIDVSLQPNLETLQDTHPLDVSLQQNVETVQDVNQPYEEIKLPLTEMYYDQETASSIKNINVDNYTIKKRKGRKPSPKLN